MFKQVTEVFRMGLVLPMTNAALAEVASMCVLDDSVPLHAWFIPISPLLFNSLWDSGVFASLNAACGTIFDEYEQDWLPVKEVTIAAKTVRRLLLHCKEDTVQEFLKELLSLLREAESLQHPVLFVL